MANYTFPDVPKDSIQAGDTITFNYTGDVQTLNTSDYNFGKIKIECYGAGSQDSGGGYAYGDLDFAAIKEYTPYLYFIVGQYNPNGGASWSQVSFGGGGACDGGRGNAGGASDVRTYYDPKATDFVCSDRSNDIDKGTLCWKSLSSRLIVAGGAGAADTNGKKQGGGAAGGGWNGNGSNNAGGGSQTNGAGGDGPSGTGRFGVGGTAWCASGAGGGGFYGGAGRDGGAGGSSYVSGNTNCPYKTLSGIELTDSGTATGKNQGFGKIVVTIYAITSGRYLNYIRQNPFESCSIPLYLNVTTSSDEGFRYLRVNSKEYAIGVTKEYLAAHEDEYDNVQLSNLTIKRGNNTYYIVKNPGSVVTPSKPVKKVVAGSKTYFTEIDTTFIVPENVCAIKIEYGYFLRIVSVTSGQKLRILGYTAEVTGGKEDFTLTNYGFKVDGRYIFSYRKNLPFTISWSDTINLQPASGSWV